MTPEIIIIIVFAAVNGVLLGFHAGRDYENKRLITYLTKLLDDNLTDDQKEPENE